MANPSGEGSFMYAAKGVYTDGPRKGEACAVKWYKHRREVYDAVAYDKVTMTNYKAAEIINAFNHAGIIDKSARLNWPEVFTADANHPHAGSKWLVEPWLPDYTKYNSNSGWSAMSDSGDLIAQSVSHCSYHTSGGKLLLCDLQGTMQRDGIVYSDVVVMSEVAGTYGSVSHTRTHSFASGSAQLALFFHSSLTSLIRFDLCLCVVYMCVCVCVSVTDAGREGIITFMTRHLCNPYCLAEWSRPKKSGEYMKLEKSSWMMELGKAAPHVPTQHNRQPMSVAVEMPPLSLKPRFKSTWGEQGPCKKQKY